LGADNTGREDGRSDARLMSDCVRDPDAFRVLYDRYAKRTFAFFERRTRDREASLDLTAETFARVWIGRARFRDLAGGSAGPWLFAIARRVLAASVEHRRIESLACEQLGLVSERHVMATPEPGWLDGIEAAFEALPLSQRHAVELRVLADLSYEAAAAGLGCSPGAARIRVSRGLTALRDALEGGTQ
jgi:RNA polymerase sigma factor (sigma-70 family)